jgi:multidrug efflux pump subunit AcrB
MKSFNLTEWALKNRVIVLFLILIVSLAGVLGFGRLGQLEDPNFSVPSMTAMVAWPGATAQQIQDEVLNRMEKKFEQLDHFEKVVTFARQGYGGMTLTVKGGTSNVDQQEAWYQARKKFDDIRQELPEGVVGPLFNDEYGDVYGLMYAVRGDGVDMAQLADRSEIIKRALLKVPMVKKVDLIGKQAERVYIEFSQERLAALGIPPLQIIESLRSQNEIVPAGSIDTRVDRVHVRVSGQFQSLEDIRQLPIAAAGKVIRLGDIATVTRGYEEPATYTVRHNGQQVLMLGIVMTRDGNIVQLGKAVAGEIARIQNELPYGIELERVADQPTTVKEAVWDFERSLVEALVIVVLVSLFSLGWRTGIVVALSVPLVLGMVAILMLAMGWNLERISLGSLIIALGLLVDDAIIALEMMVVKMETGWDKVKAAAFSYSATAFPRLSGALITVAAFMPIGFSRSTTGEYAGGIFWIVGAAVLLSWLCSGLFTPYLAVKLLPNRLGDGHGNSHVNPYDTPMFRRLRRWIEMAIVHRWKVIGATAGLLVLAIASVGLVPQQFFPNSTRPELVVDLRVKEGASFAATSEQVQRMEKILAKDRDVRFFTAYTGAGAPRFYLSLNPELPNPGFAQFVVMTRDLEARERVRSRLMELAQEQFPTAWVRVTRLELGPPVGYPVQFRIVGPDAQQVRSIAREVEQVVRANPQTRDVQLDWNEPVRNLRIALDQDKVRALGLSASEVALATQSLMQGAPLGQMREGEELVDIVGRAVRRERLDIDTLRNVSLYTRQGDVVPLAQVATVKSEQEEPVLWRRNRDMAITVRADVVDGAQAVTVTKAIQPLMREIEAKLPSGYRIDVGGAVEESDKANAALVAVAPLMLVTILVILILQVRSFSLMTIVLLTAPLGLIGVVAALLLFQAPLGFVAILGVIALSGMIMRNAVILIDQVQTETAGGQDAWNAVVGAAVQRARPVVLTAAATVLAMIPLTRSVFWGPMAIAIMGGLTIATLLTIFFVPALYAAWFRVARTDCSAADAITDAHTSSPTIDGLQGEGAHP